MQNSLYPNGLYSGESLTKLQILSQEDSDGLTKVVA